jgi:hypothetical protein
MEQPSGPIDAGLRLMTNGDADRLGIGLSERLRMRLYVARQALGQAFRLVDAVPRELAPGACRDFEYDLRDLAHLAMALSAHLADLAIEDREAACLVIVSEAAAPLEDVETSRRWTLALLQQLAEVVDTAEREQLLDVRQQLTAVLEHLAQPAVLT